MPKSKTALEKWWHGFLARLPCVVCPRSGEAGDGPLQIHHVAEGSGLRSHFSCVRLCKHHHDFFHARPVQFLKIYRVPGETEYGLLVWQMEDIAARLKRRFGWQIL